MLSRPRVCGRRRAGDLRICCIIGTPRANGFRALAARVLEGGQTIQALVEMEAGLLLVKSISDGSSLAILAAATCDTDLVAYEMTLLVEAVGGELPKIAPRGLNHEVDATDELDRWQLTDLAQSDAAEGGYGFEGLTVDPPAAFRHQRQLADAETRRLKLERQLAAVQEEERTELARDLHDEIGPLLFAVGIDLSVIQHDQMVRDTAVAARIGAVRESVARIYDDIKRILGRLRTASPSELGLAQAVENLLSFWRMRYPAVEFSCEVADDDFGAAIDDAIYHVIMESLSNALRHGNPTSLAIAVTVIDGEVVIRGPEGPTGVSLTPAAAALTAERLAAAARKAALAQASHGSAGEA